MTPKMLGTSDSATRPTRVGGGTRQDGHPARSALLIGNVNVGKTTLFNRVCSRSSKAANFPGTTVSVGRGSLAVAGHEYCLIDSPGINSIVPESEDESITQKILLEEEPDIIAQIA